MQIFVRGLFLGLSLSRGNPELSRTRDFNDHTTFITYHRNSTAPEADTSLDTETRFCIVDDQNLMLALQAHVTKNECLREAARKKEEVDTPCGEQQACERAAAEEAPICEALHCFSHFDAIIRYCKHEDTREYLASGTQHWKEAWEKNCTAAGQPGDRAEEVVVPSAPGSDPLAPPGPSTAVPPAAPFPEAICPAAAQPGPSAETPCLAPPPDASMKLPRDEAQVETYEDLEITFSPLGLVGASLNGNN